MDKLEGLHAGVEEMRSVAKRLMEWADDLEKSLLKDSAGEKGRKKGKAAAGEAACEGAGSVAADVSAGSGVSAAIVAAPMSLAEVRGILAGKCAAGFAAQVKALIESYGVASLRDVPPDKYVELVEAVKGLGDPDAG